MATEPRALYADSSALVKLIVREPETDALQALLARAPYELVSSRLALVEVPRAVLVATSSAQRHAAAVTLVDSCTLFEVSEHLLRRAALLASVTVRALDAIHLATALRVGPHAMLVYDRRLAAAARAAGLAVEHPGAE